MNKAIIAGLAAGVLVVGLIFSPLFNPLSAAQAANETGAKRHVTLIASEKVVQVAPDNDLHPGGIMYNAMVFNGTIPGPVVAVNQGDTLEITLKNEGKVIHSLDFHA
ncbi:MAG: multicopper oxidase domain-containing protein, partial [Nitrososphaera sp.]